MKKPVIAIDIDDVLADSTESIRRQANTLLNIDLSTEHYRVPGPYWRYYEHVWEQHGFALKLADLDMNMTSDQSHIPVYDEAVWATDILAKNYKLILVSARDKQWEAATKAWLDTHFHGVFSGIFFADAHGGAHGNHLGKTKGQLCAENGAAWLIDDNIEHALTARASGVEPVLFGQYGWHVDVPMDIIRCPNWKAVVEYFEQEL